MLREEFFKVPDKIADFIFKIWWGNKVGDIIKLNALWGVVIILIGVFMKFDWLIALGIGMCCAFVSLLLTTGLFFGVVIILELVWNLFQYTEKVIFNKNRLFMH